MARVSRLRSRLGGTVLVLALAGLGFQAFWPSQTRLVDRKIGDGPAAKRGDRVSVHYVGQLTDGTVFDSSKTRNQPFEFELGRGVVIQGWDAGIVGMRVGGGRSLEVPPSEGYGARGFAPRVPPDSTLRFEIELVGLR